MQHIKVLIVEDEPLLCQVYETIFNDVYESHHIFKPSITTCTYYEAAKETIASDTLFDIAIIDMRLPSKAGVFNEYGKELAAALRASSKATKLVIITSIRSNHLFYQISRAVNPEGFMIKSEIEPESFKEDILRVLNGKVGYTKSIINFFRHQTNNSLLIDDIDREILHLLLLGVPTKSIPDYVPLSLSGVELRKRNLRSTFNLKEATTTHLIEAAKAHHII